MQTKNHITTSTTAKAVPTHRILSLFIALPIEMVAMVNPTLGKTNAHHVRWKDIPEVIAPTRTDTQEIEKNHNDVAHKNTALARAMARNSEGRRDELADIYVMAGDGEIDEKTWDIDSNASAVNDGGPT